jgi:bacterioferritin-associated ferredoxin
MTEAIGEARTRPRRNRKTMTTTHTAREAVAAALAALRSLPGWQGVSSNYGDCVEHLDDLAADLAEHGWQELAD